MSQDSSSNRSADSTARAQEKTEQVAREVAANDPKGQKGNGNNYELEETKTGGAQTGGPGIDRAREKQPPDAARTKSDA